MYILFRKSSEGFLLKTGALVEFGLKKSFRSIFGCGTFQSKVRAVAAKKRPILDGILVFFLDFYLHLFE